MSIFSILNHPGSVLVYYLFSVILDPIFLKYYFQVSFNLKAILSMVKRTQNTATSFNVHLFYICKTGSPLNDSQSNFSIHNLINNYCIRFLVTSWFIPEGEVRSSYQMKAKVQADYTLIARPWLLCRDRFSIECCKTKIKPITYQLDYSTNLKL